MERRHPGREVEHGPDPKPRLGQRPVDVKRCSLARVDGERTFDPDASHDGSQLCRGRRCSSIVTACSTDRWYATAGPTHHVGRAVRALPRSCRLPAGGCTHWASPSWWSPTNPTWPAASLDTGRRRDPPRIAAPGPARRGIRVPPRRCRWMLVPQTGAGPASRRPGDLGLDWTKRHGRDRWRDVEAGRRAGCRTVHIDRGYCEATPRAPMSWPRSLAEAVRWIEDVVGGEGLTV